MLFLWTFAILAFRHVLALNAEVGGFEALYLYSVYDYDATVRGAAENRVDPKAHDGDKAYDIEKFLKFVAPTRKVLDTDEDGNKIPGKWIELPRWDKVNWDAVQKDLDDLETIAYELLNANFSMSQAVLHRDDIDNPLGDEKTLTNQLVLIVDEAKALFGDAAKQKFEKVKTLIQAVGDVHRKAAADGLRNTFKNYKEFKEFNKIYTKTTDKAPVRAFQEIDMEKTFKENGKAGSRQVMSHLSDFRMSGARGGASDMQRRLDRQMNNIDNLQRNTQRLTPRPKRACTI